MPRMLVVSLIFTAGTCLSQTYTTIDIPGAIKTSPALIDSQGDVAGTYYPGPVAQLPHGFFRSAAGVISTFDPPGAIATFVSSMNGAGDLVGRFDTGSPGGGGGFLRKNDGTLTIFTVPGLTQPIPVSINSQGDIVGRGTDATNTVVDFILTSAGVLTTYSAAHATVGIINDVDAVAGDIEVGQTATLWDLLNLMAPYRRFFRPRRRDSSAPPLCQP